MSTVEKNFWEQCCIAFSIIVLGTCAFILCSPAGPQPKPPLIAKYYEVCLDGDCYRLTEQQVQEIREVLRDESPQ